MKRVNLEVGDVLQLNPGHRLGPMLIVVTEPKEWGCHGYLMSQFNIEGLIKFKGVAYLRVKFEDMEYVGRLNWIMGEKEEARGENPP